MTYTVGTPPFKILGIADTGSDLIWSQCNPCNACYNQTAPLFDPAKSITYKKVSCAARQCESLGNEASCSLGSCTYAAHYGDQSYSYGDLAFEKLTLGSTNGRPVSFPKTAIGCGHKNDGTFNEKGSGIVGLGGGELSLVSQIKSSIGGKFSYCLVPLFSESSKTSSKLNFGENAIVSGPGTVSTPRVSKSPDTFYYLTLEALSVGEKRLEFFESSSRRSNYVEGNIIIDSGTTLTLLPENVYSRLESAVQESIQAEPVTDPTGVLSLCYSSTGNDIKVPVITAHFTGADVKLNPVNTFVSVTEDVAVLCICSKSNILYLWKLGTNELIGWL
ncbi:aspartic proteinase CDR1-like [Quillaja saponaria]|uniref:Aspartic proteinase CDR1-like n=1 Tax=Quillaja saponaria TaxID=32244 RepID=A0AAD7L153_QUISA|nr:aspartic proteinase CDR1-like [Quillaja saponaria]